MEQALTVTGIVITFCYALFVLSIFTGLKRLRRPASSDTPRVSIVVAARNEEANIGNLLNALAVQDYPSDLCNIIIVNDRSTDKTRSIVEEFALKDSRFSVIDAEGLPEGYSPKKYALTKGIQKADGEIIVTTDADCVPPPAWVSAMVRYFEEDVGMVMGFSPLIVQNGGRLFSEYLYIDAMSLAIVAAGGTGWNTGWTCTGRNLAYRRSVFHEVGGYEEVKDQISGDDDLLLHLVLQKTGWKVRYAAGSDPVVPSYLQPGFGSFVNQRTRHASKFRVYPLYVKVTALCIFLFYLSLGAYPVVMAAARQVFPVFVLMLGVKFLLEFLTIRRGAGVLAGRFSVKTFLYAFFVHPFLIVLFSIRGARGKFTWKDRAFHQK
ncbi:glycosyltransferase [candidate division KSB1 bacterium]